MLKKELFDYMVNNRKVKITYRKEQHQLDLDLIDDVEQLRRAARSVFTKLPKEFDILLQNLSGNSLTNQEIYLMKNYDHETTLFIKNIKDEQMDIQSISSQPSKIELLDSRQNQQFKEQLKDFDQEQQEILFEKEPNKNNEEKSFQSLTKDEVLIGKEKQVLNEDIQCNGCFAFPIQGIIYKCLVCQDYDLCQKCQQSKHQFHPLLKITKKGQYPRSIKVKFSKKSQTQMQKMAQADKLNEQRLKKIKYHGNIPNYEVIDPSTLPSQKVCQKNFISVILGSID